MKNASRHELARSRRWFLFATSSTCLAAHSSEKLRIIPSAVYRYSDPSTEFQVLRLTDPSHISRLPPHYSRPAPRHGNYLLYSSDVTGRMEGYRIDLKTGISYQFTEMEGLDPASLNLTPDDRAVCCTAGGRMLLVNLANLRYREVYRIPAGFEASGGLGLSEDGLFAALVERKNGRFRLRLIRMADGDATTLAEGENEIRDPNPRPRRGSVLFFRGNDLHLVTYDGRQNYRLRLAGGKTGPATWSRDGRSILYLNYPDDPHRLHNIREFVPDTNEDKTIADTTQFVGFERNTDASVFVGASGGKASPHVLLLVRAAKREFTLCEHRASDPQMVAPIFSPNSQHVFFTSDRHGKPAIYAMEVEKLVAETDTQ